jgi:cytochrome c-type biogenesis protein CcmH
VKHILLGVLAALLFIAAAQAIDTEPAFEDPVLQARYDYLVHQLRCVQCRNQSIADSNVELAADLRVVVRDLIAKGDSDEQILKFMSDRYGEYVLLKPPFTPYNWILWVGPILLLGVGGFLAARFILAKSRLPTDDAADNDSSNAQGAS